ncbi:APC family permease [candidate division WWE3 bacterium]|uniref:APC family permease n=1 Tax=candidate division WWE3 bacterium TaxID=2053526 RepID=A0A955LGM1_UNCKA|nr:APC family permease [candidate division WWE3 bacterium]
MKQHVHTKLNQFFATAICGNDILSSALYVSGIAIIFSGIYAPIVLLIVSIVLFLYKAVYTEVVEALPINGGAYNCLLNGTSKTLAAIAGVMTTLSYIATAVISAKIAIEYVHTLVEIPVIPATIVLLGIFGLIVISGIKDSAKVALGIFIFHILTLIAFLLVGVWFIATHGSIFSENVGQTVQIIADRGSIIRTIFLAFAASLLGVSGFESSANFVEEQQKGVFRKTLRNMLIGVAIFNPLIAFIILHTVPYGIVNAAKDFLLADAAGIIGGQVFQIVVVADAFLVLSGAVLTSFVGVSGLLSRMAADNCLPEFFSHKNDKDSYPRIIVGFFVLCSSILLITKGELLSLAGVYTIAFLGVMSLFALGNLILRETRTELKRTYYAPVPFIILAFLATTAGIVGNAIINPHNLLFFSYYFVPGMILVLIVIYQGSILHVLLRLLAQFPILNKQIHDRYVNSADGNFIAFVHNVDRLHSILDYVNRNENGWNITLIHCSEGEDETKFNEIKEALPMLQKAGVFPHFNINLVQKKMPFGPEAIDEVAEEYDINKNRIMIGSIHHHHPYDYEDLGGVRIIF